MLWKIILAIVGMVGRLFWQLSVWDEFFLSQFARPFFLGKEPE